MKKFLVTANVEATAFITVEADNGSKAIELALLYPLSAWSTYFNRPMTDLQVEEDEYKNYG